jgi:hypothetical protein
MKSWTIACENETTNQGKAKPWIIADENETTDPEK